MLLRIIAAMLLASLLAFVIGGVVGVKVAEPVIYEDGSGRFPDGRVFCIKGELCE